MKVGTVMKHFASLLLLAALLCLAVGSNDSPSVSSGQEKRISGDHWFGCTDREYFDKLVGYAVQKDNKAFKKALAAGLVLGTCTIFKNGEVVYITDTAISSGLVKVRRKGETQEYWTNIEAVE